MDRECTLAGWGRFPTARGHLFRPERPAELAALVAGAGDQSLIARGLGRSYGDPALNLDGGVVDCTRLNRFLAFDPETGVLDCEGGVSFAAIIDTFLPRGFFLPVTPGTKFVTVGGAIANDVHGKNHHRDGSIASFVLDFRLLLPSGEVRVCSRDAHSEVFWATLGGVGLTGFIVSARLRLVRVPSAYVRVDYAKAPNLDAVLALFEADERYTYSVAWIDCLAGGKSLGRSVLMRGDPAAITDLPASIPHPYAMPASLPLALPFDLPSGVLNPLSVGAFNALFYGKHRNVEGQIVGIEPYFYPLDAIGGWNRLYGKRGFVQYQVAFPEADGGAGLRLVLERLARSGRASFLAVLKRFGAGNEGLLSFPIKGMTLALDLPAAPGIEDLLRELDRLALGHGGRVYLAKDAVTTPESFAAMYPALPRFREIQRALDPKGVLRSSMSRRLGLVHESL